MDPVASCWLFLPVFSVFGVPESFFWGITLVQSKFWVSPGCRHSAHSLGRNVCKTLLPFPQSATVRSFVQMLPRAASPGLELSPLGCNFSVLISSSHCSGLSYSVALTVFKVIVIFKSLTPVCTDADWAGGHCLQISQYCSVLQMCG